jgi:hypothetical protein
LSKPVFGQPILVRVAAVAEIGLFTLSKGSSGCVGVAEVAVIIHFLSVPSKVLDVFPFLSSLRFRFQMIVIIRRF